MQIAGLGLADRLADHGQKGDHVVADPLLEVVHLLDVEAGCPDLGQRVGRDATQVSPTLCGQHLDLQPEFETPAIGPDLPHPRRRISLDQEEKALLDNGFGGEGDYRPRKLRPDLAHKQSADPYILRWRGSMRRWIAGPIL